MTITPPNPNSVEWPHVRVFLPYSELYPATLISLIGFNYQPVKTEGEFGYSEYWKQRWTEGETFINVEQDIVVHPGAIMELWNCPQEWCAFDFHLPNHQMRVLENELDGVPIGCVKISSSAISKTPDIWDESVGWAMCEQTLTKGLTRLGMRVHQHKPGVVNANKVFLDFLGGTYG